MNSKSWIVLSFIYSDWSRDCSEDKENAKQTKPTQPNWFFRNGNSELGMPDIR